MDKRLKKEYAILYKKIEKILINFDKSKLPLHKKLYILKNDIKKEIEFTYNNVSKELNKSLNKIAHARYLKTLFLSEKGSKINISQHSVDKVDNFVDYIVNRYVAGKTLHQRIKRNKEFIINQSRIIITNMIKKGNSIPQISKELQRILGIDKSKALTIARTEGHRIQEEATSKGYDEAKTNNIEFDKEWMATLDNKTRDKHKELDGQIADKDGYFWSGEHKTKYPGGFGVASLDIHCRCTTRAKFKNIQGADTRYVQETGEYIEYKTYKEWAAAHNV